MRILIITQDDPFYLAENINYLLENFPKNSEVVACCMFDVSPFGKRESFFDKAIKTWRIFGFSFFTYYALRFIGNRLNPRFKLKRVLEKHGVPTIQLSKPINSSESVKILQSYSPDLLVSIAGNQIFKKPIIELAPKGCLNLHTALLPKYRGLMPTFWVLKNNEKETGVSVFFVDEGIDSGPIIVQERVDIGEMSQEELISHTKKVGMVAIIKAINLIEIGEYELIENDEENMTYYTFPTREDVIGFLKAGKRFF